MVHLRRAVLLVLLLPLAACNATQNAMLSGVISDTQAGATEFHKNEAAVYSRAPCSISVEGLLTMSKEKQEAVITLCRQPELGIGPS